MAHKGNQVKDLLRDIKLILSCYYSKNTAIKFNEQLKAHPLPKWDFLPNNEVSEEKPMNLLWYVHHVKKIRRVTSDLEELNKSSFFTSEPQSIPIITKYIGMVSRQVSALEDFHHQHYLEHDVRINHLLLQLWGQLNGLHENLREELSEIELANQPAAPEIKIPTPALIRLCKHDNDATAEQRAKELCDRCRGKNLSPGKVIAHLFIIGCVITSKNQYDKDYQESYVKKILIENGLITSCGNDTIRKALKRELDKIDRRQ